LAVAQAALDDSVGTYRAAPRRAEARSGQVMQIVVGPANEPGAAAPHAVRDRVG
jgi:hypothetical protein